MSTVVRRTIISSPQRTTTETWSTIVSLLTRDESGDKRTALESVSGICASVIAERTPKDAPIVVTCDGPRTRIYCVYDHDAVDGSDANEAPLGFDPLNGDWEISLPCLEDDLEWVQAALVEHTSRITARKPEDTVEKQSEPGEASAMTINTESFLAS